MDKMQQELTTLREQYTGQLAGAEQSFQQMQSKIQEYRSKIAAIDTLIGNGETSAKTAGTLPQASPDEDHGAFTPVRAYWKPLLQVLVELGGRGHRVKVIDLVGEKMKDILTDADKGKLPKSGYSRWRNRVAWQASQMRSAEQGFIKSDSRRGIWEITEAGRKWLDDNSN
jgi:hypothetical protein